MDDKATSLRQGLRVRHIQMISLGGIIGAGLFVGSGAVIHTAGPAAIVSYVMSGLIVILVMRMLGELSAASPAVGSFAEYARHALGPWAGFAIGWLYWYFWVIAVALEATAGAAALQLWLPTIPVWLVSFILTLLLTITNVWSVRSYGEFEYWFASIKVAAIILFLVTGTLYVLGLWPGGHLNFSNLVSHSGFAPNGWGPVFQAVVIVAFSYVGTEIATIAAGESREPEKAVTRATKSVILRTLLFFVGSIFLIVVILPWNDTVLLKSPFVSALERLRVPGAAAIMNFVVITAVLSCLNSALYAASRMLYSLAIHGDAPSILHKVNEKGVPVWAVLASTLFGYVSIILDYISPDKAFLFLINTSGSVALYMWLIIALSELRLRKKLELEAPERLHVRMWGYPYLTILTIVIILVVLFSMAFMESTRSQFWMGILSLSVVLGLYMVRKRRSDREETQGAGTDFSS